MTSAKATLRAAARDARAKAHGTVDPAPALASLEGLLASRLGRAISFYLPIRSEIDPSPVMERLAGRTAICLPVTHGRDAALTFRLWQPGEALIRDDFGCNVPANGPEVQPETLVVPLLAFDRSGHRLGYGAGHYDRTLDLLRKRGPVMAIGLAYAAQELSHIPAEPTDQRLDLIVTDAEIIQPV